MVSEQRIFLSMTIMSIFLQTVQGSWSSFSAFWEQGGFHFAFENKNIIFGMIFTTWWDYWCNININNLKILQVSSECLEEAAERSTFFPSNKSTSAYFWVILYQNSLSWKGSSSTKVFGRRQENKHSPLTSVKLSFTLGFHPNLWEKINHS